MHVNELNLKAKEYYEDNKDRLKDSMKIFQEFRNLYPFHEHPEKIDLLEPDDIYNPGNESFLYYIEHGLPDFGRLKVGGDEYSRNAKNNISKFKKLLKIAVDDSLSIVEKVDAPWDNIKRFGGDRMVAKKIIFCYNPEKILPIYKTEHLEYYAAQIDKDFRNKPNKFHKSYDEFSSGQKFEYLNNILLQFKNETVKSEMDNTMFMHFLYDMDPMSKIYNHEIKNSPSEIKIRYFIEKTLKNHDSEKQEDLGEIRYLFEKGIPMYLEDIANDSIEGNIRQYRAEGIPGTRQMYSPDEFGYMPQIYFFDEKAKQNRFSEYNFYIIYILREDRKGIYLSLNHAQDYMKEVLKEKDEWESWFKDKKLENSLKDRVNQIRSQLGKINGFSEVMDLNPQHASSGSIFEAASIYSKYYTLENLPSEEELISDFKDMLSLYRSLVIKNKGLTVIEDPNEIEKAQEIFENRFRELVDETEFEKLKRDKFRFSKLGIWASFKNPNFFHNKNPNYFYNPFGIGEPAKTTINDAVVEINFSLTPNRQISAAFAKDSSNNIHLLHRGRLGGKFVGKPILEENYNGEWVEAQDGDRKGKFILIGGLNESNFPEKVKDFVLEVYRIKNGGIVKDLNFLDYLNENGFYFEPKLIENFLLSLKVKPFLILTGNSGTGKTKIAQLFAQYLNPSSKVSNEEYVEIGSINRSLTSYSRKNNGGWRFKPNELNNLDQNQFSGLAENSEDLILELRLNNESKSGKGYIKKEKQSYSEDVQFYLYYHENSPFYNAINQIDKDNVDIYLLQKRKLIKENKKYEIVPVGANWTENRHIIGFYNVITKEFQKTKSLKLIMQAEGHQKAPFFLILDEMNLSHVERYFSDFLSAMESKESIELHQNEDIEEDVPQKIKFSENLMVIGTVNVDETTYMFSPKVLDRANTIEFSTPSVSDYMNEEMALNKLKGNINYLENPLSDIKIQAPFNPELNIRNASISEIKKLCGNITTSEGVFWNIMRDQIEEFQNILKKAGFDFGFRVINEIMRFMYVSWVYEGKQSNWDNWNRYFDAQIKQKMLPRIHGSQRTLEDVLDNLILQCNNYPTSKKKLEEMKEVLYKQRYVSFTN